MSDQNSNVQTSKPQLRRVIECARALMARQGFARRRAIAAALKICQRTAVSRQPSVDYARREASLEYLQHRNRSMAGVR